MQREFHADRVNWKWCMDFMYLFLKNGEVCYNCSSVALYHQSVTASVTECKNTIALLSEL